MREELRTRAGVVVLACLLAASACQSPRPPSPGGAIVPKPGGTLHLWIPAAGVLDPLFLDDVYEATVTVNLFDGLVYFDDNLSVMPGLAEEWTVSRDGRIYDFKLRSGVRFHDGAPLEIEDVLFTYRRAMTLRNPTAINEILRRLVDEEYTRGERRPRIFALDDRTLRIILRQPYSEFLKIVAMDQLRVVPRKHFPADGPKPGLPIIGTGPFILDLLEPGQISLRRNEAYFRGAPHIDRVEFSLIPELKPARKVDLFRQGRLDVMEAFNIPKPEQVVSPDHWIVKAELSTSFLVFNCERMPTDNLQFRRAFVAAFDRQAYFRRTFRGVKPTESVLPPGMPGYLPVTGRYRHNPGEAALLLERAGIAPEKMPVLDVLLSSDDPLAVECYQRAADVLGIRAQIRFVADWSEFTRQMDAGQFHVTQLVWAADTPIPEQFYQSLLSSNSAQNVARFRDEKFDSLIFRMFFEQNLNEKQNIIRTIEARVQEYVPYMPVENYIMNFMVHPRVHDARMSPFGLLSLNFANLWIEDRARRR